MPNNIIEVRFGGEQAEFLSITVRGRAYRQSQDYWDGNWLLVTVVIRAGKFSGEIAGMLRAEELQKLRDDLREFQRTLSGSVSYETAEEWLSLQIEADTLGSIALSGTISDDVSDSYNTLEFTLEGDQTFLASPLQQLEQVMQAYPVIGEP